MHDCIFSYRVDKAPCHVCYVALLCPANWVFFQSLAALWGSQNQIVILCEIPQKIVQQGIFALVPLFFFLLSSLLIGTKDSLVGGEVKRSSNSSTNLWTTSFTELTGQIHFRGSPLGNFFFTDLVINFITKLVLISFLIRRLRSTMWKFCNFSASLILREINFDWFQRFKIMSLLAILEAWNFDV